MVLGHSVGNHNDKGRPLHLAFPQADYSDNSADSANSAINASIGVEGPKLHVCFCCPPSLIPSLLGHQMD